MALTGPEVSQGVAPGGAYTPTFIHPFSIRRSGSHAIVHWLAEGLAGENERAVLHANNVTDGEFPESEPDHIKASIAELRPDFVILNYEDCSFAERHALEHRQTFSNDRDTDVIMLRSFQNMMASQMQRRRTVEAKGLGERPILRLGLAGIRDLWVEHAEAILDSDGNTPTGVLYDTWVTDRDYRDEIGARIGFTNRDAGLQHVPGNGEGSSFDGTSFQGRGHEMQVLDRWRFFTQDGTSRASYLPLITPRVIELNRELFGSDPSILP